MTHSMRVPPRLAPVRFQTFPQVTSPKIETLPPTRGNLRLCGVAAHEHEVIGEAHQHHTGQPDPAWVQARAISRSKVWQMLASRGAYRDGTHTRQPDTASSKHHAVVLEVVGVRSHYDGVKSSSRLGSTRELFLDGPLSYVRLREVPRFVDPAAAQPVLRIPAAMPLMVSSSARSRSGSSSPARSRASSCTWRRCSGSR